MTRTLTIVSLLLVTASGCTTLGRVKLTPKKTPGFELASADLRDAPRDISITDGDIESRGARLSDIKSVRFTLDSTLLDDQARTVLRENARILKAHPNVRVTVAGHADDRGTTEYNIALSHKRAVAVKNFYNHLGIAKKRLAPRSYGEERPLCLAETEECWKANRRAATQIETRSLLGR
jgi:peptidoglycan-associated lipoprotein